MKQTHDTPKNPPRCTHGKDIDRCFKCHQNKSQAPKPYNNKFVSEVMAEVEASNVRMSSNDDVEYCVQVIDKLAGKLNLYDRQHPEGCHCIYCD